MQGIPRTDEDGMPPPSLPAAGIVLLLSRDWDGSTRRRCIPNPQIASPCTESVPPHLSCRQSTPRWNASPDLLPHRPLHGKSARTARRGLLQRPDRLVTFAMRARCSSPGTFGPQSETEASWTGIPAYRVRAGHTGTSFRYAGKVNSVGNRYVRVPGPATRFGDDD